MPNDLRHNLMYEEITPQYEVMVVGGDNEDRGDG